MAPTQSNRTSEILLRLRRESGLSQRALAEMAGTSGPTIAAYESGTKEPRLSTVERLAASVGRDVSVRLIPSDRGALQRARRQRRSLAVAAATAEVAASDFDAARRLAGKNLQKMSEAVGDNAAQTLIEDWRRVLSRGPRAVKAALLDPTAHGHDMRQMTPFAGLLTDGERRAALAAADAFDVLEAASVADRRG